MDYRDVGEDPELIREMVEFSKGRRQVPVIIEGRKVTVGYGGT